MARPSAAYCHLLANEVGTDKIEHTHGAHLTTERLLIPMHKCIHVVSLSHPVQIRITGLYAKQRIVESILASLYIPIVLLPFMLVITQSQRKISSTRGMWFPRLSIFLAVVGWHESIIITLVVAACGRPRPPAAGKTPSPAPLPSSGHQERDDEL